jgi:hypothetical protein
VNAEGAGLVTCCRDNAAGGRSADRQLVAAQIGIIALLDRRIKRDHVDVHDFSNWGHGGFFDRDCICILSSCRNEKRK